MLGMTANARILLGAASLGVIAAASVALPSSAAAQAARKGNVSLSAMPMEAALRAIAAQTGETINFDPDAVKGLTSQPVQGARNARRAVQAAIAGTGLTVIPGAQEGLVVVNEIVVTARRDEAETSVLVRQATTSDRNGLGLRDQPRNTQVITAKTIEDQQALDITDVLRNAGGVSTQFNNPGGGSTYTVRGLNASGLINGLSAAGQYGITAGASQPVANIERVEILKGPDALLAGFDNLGGNINVVTKKPSAEERLAVSFDMGSFGLVRGVIDANNAITANNKLSGRVVASAQTMDRNFGGYTGNKNWLFAPSLRFKDRLTDIVIGASLSNDINGLTPYTLFNRMNRQIIDRDPSVPIYSSNQQIRQDTSRFYFDATRAVTSGIDIVVRGLHDQTHLGLDLYPLSYSTRRNNLQLAIRGSAQRGTSNAIDGFVRIKAHIADVVKMRLNVGYNFSKGFSESLSSTQYIVINDAPAGTIPLGVNNTLAVQPRPAVNPASYRTGSQQEGLYGQAMVEVWKLKVLGGVRKSWYENTFEFYGTPPAAPNRANATSPNFGVIFDATSDFSIFANYIKGVSPVTSLAFDKSQLPNITTTNKEAGVKLDLFHKRATINASYFDVMQDNVLLADPAHPGFLLPGPGQRGRGVDLNVVGQILPGWTVQGSFTRTNYKLLVPTTTRTVAAQQPRDTYSLYSTYRTRITDDVSGGIGGGLFGRSSSFADFLGQYVVPAAHQVDVNGFVSYKGFDINLGIRNLFDRRNYGVTTSPDFVPYGETRNVRLSISKRLF